MPREALSFFRGDKQNFRLLDQPLRVSVRRWFPRVLCFIHRNDELGEWLQPCKPRIINKELQKAIWRLNPANDSLIGHSLRLDQHLVQAQKRVPDIL